MIAGLLVAPAYALDRDVCIQVDHEFTDTLYTAQRYDLDDFLNDDDVPEPLRGVLIWVTGAGYHQVGYADDQTGCRTFTGLTNGASYTIWAWSEALVEGHTIELFDDDDSSSLYSYSWPNWTVWMAVPVTTKTVTASSTDIAAWDTMTAATFALHRRDGGLPPQTFTLYHEICPTSNGSCYDDDNDAVYIDPNSNSKFVVAHELGHYLAHRKIGNGGKSSLGADPGDCHGLWDNNPLTPDPSHEMQSKEYQSGAFWEGFAHFYGAVVFNRTNEADCFVQYYKPESYDLDQDQDPNTVNCAGVPWEDAAGNLMDTTDLTNDPAVDADDYFYDMTHELMLPGGCDPGGVEVNRATEYDYLRALWAMVQQGTTLVQVMDVMNLAKLDGGCVDYPPGLQTCLDPIDNDDGAGSNQLADRLLFAFVVYDSQHATSLASTWSTQADTHGVDR